MLYKAICDGDIGIKGTPKIKSDKQNGYKQTACYFVDSSGFGRDDELALPFAKFLKQVKKGYYYGIAKAGQFQVYINEYKKIEADDTSLLKLDNKEYKIKKKKRIRCKICGNFHGDGTYGNCGN